MKNLLKPFGKGGMADVYGYDLPILIGWLESLLSTEGETVVSPKGLKMKRIGLVEDALAKLNEAMDMGDEIR